MSENPVDNRDKKGRFAKGNTLGNGRPKGIVAYVKSLSNDYQDYFTLLDQWARDDNVSIKDRKACINELLNRTLGMPKQTIDQTINTPEPISFVLDDGGCKCDK